MPVLVKCSNCEKEVYKSPCHIKRSKYHYCSSECRVSGMKGKGLGKDNPNFGKKWDDARKERQSEIIKSKVDEEYRLKCAKGMSGATVSEETKKKKKDTMMERYGRLSNILSLSEEAKNIIGKKSREKFTPEFKAKFYENMVERGIWLRREDKDPYHFYRRISNWNCNVLSYDVKGGDQAIKLGIYNYKLNPSGLVRDHRFSRLSGFKLGVFPEIVRHPFNCELISLADNARKHHSKNIDSDSISLTDLFEGVKNYNKDYPEQLICLEKIKQYENGLRYDPKDYLNIY